MTIIDTTRLGHKATAHPVGATGQVLADHRPTTAPDQPAMKPAWPWAIGSAPLLPSWFRRAASPRLGECEKRSSAVPRAQIAAALRWRSGCRQRSQCRSCCPSEPPMSGGLDRHQKASALLGSSKSLGRWTGPASPPVRRAIRRVVAVLAESARAQMREPRDCQSAAWTRARGSARRRPDDCFAMDPIAGRRRHGSMVPGTGRRSACPIRDCWFSRRAAPRCQCSDRAWRWHRRRGSVQSR